MSKRRLTSQKVYTNDPVLKGNDREQREKILNLEEELEKVSLQLTSVRKERDKQRQELASLSQEHNQLMHQKEQRIKRNQLANQLNDLSKSVKRKTSKKHRALEDLEQAKSRHCQLKRTLDLLQGGVQSILAKSYYFDQKNNKTADGRMLSDQRQKIWKELLSEELKLRLLTPSISSLGYTHESLRPHQNGSLDDEDDDIINDGVEDVVTTTLFANKNKRLDSATSEVSVNDYMVHAESAPTSTRPASFRVPSIAAMTPTVTNDNNHSSRSRKSRSRDRSKSDRRQSPSAGSTSQRNRSGSKDRSTRSSHSQSKNKSQSRRGRRPNLTDGPRKGRNHQASEEDDTINRSTSTSKQSDLASLLESSQGGYSGDDPSEDTPKTANTNG